MGRRAGAFWDTTAVAAFLLLAVISCWSTIWFGFEIGADEHYEVTKSFLWSKGFLLYHEIWDDQQPLLTILQGLLFKCFGAEAGVARCLALAFSALLISGLFHLVRKSFGVLAAFAATIGLLAAPHVFELSLSPMNELPAFAVGLWSLWAIRRWDQDRRRVWLVVSGLILAVALQIKLTAVIVAPALVIELAVFTLTSPRAGKFAEFVRNGLVWGGSLLGGFVLLSLVLGAGYHQAYASHFAVRDPQALAEVRRLALTLGDLLRYRQALFVLAAALGLAAWRGSWKRLAFPLALFSTALAVHIFHRPFWSYYYLHLALPVAWLTGYVVGELWKVARETIRSAPRPSIRGFGLALAAPLLSIIVVGYGGVRLHSEIEGIRGVRRIDTDCLVAAMRAGGPRTQWIYTRATMYAFHAKLRVIPELAVMPLKRFWSGQITRTEILAVVKRFRPEQLLLDDRDMGDAEMARFVNDHYRLVTEASGLALWIASGR